MKIAKLIGGGLAALGFAIACGGMSTQAGGSNTNWFATCSTSAECGGGLDCWCGICTKACATECSSASAAATCSAPPASCTDPSKKSACAVQCAKDADCKDVGATATCVDSVCRKVTKTTPVSDAGQPLTCEERTAEAVARLTPLEAAAAEACTTSDDCVAFPGLSCVGGCGNGVISKAGASAIAGQINSIDTSICGPFTAAGCIAIQPPCPSPGNPACVGGKCQRMLPGQPTDSGTQSCDARATSINDQVFPVLEALDKSCKVNSDCTRVQPNLQCDFGCFVPASKTAASAFEATRAKLDRDLCAPYLADGCTPLLTGCPAVPAEDPHCVKGVCSDVFTVTPDDAGQSCDDRTTALNAEVKPVVDSADRACAIDGDCKVVMLVDDCIESCTYAPASATGAKSIQDELSTIDASECPAFKSAGCTVLRLPCVAPPTPRCSGGKCAVP